MWNKSLANRCNTFSKISIGLRVSKLQIINTLLNEFRNSSSKMRETENQFCKDIPNQIKSRIGKRLTTWRELICYIINNQSFIKSNQNIEDMKL